MNSSERQQQPLGGGPPPGVPLPPSLSNSVRNAAHKGGSRSSPPAAMNNRRPAVGGQPQRTGPHPYPHQYNPAASLQSRAAAAVGPTQRDFKGGPPPPPVGGGGRPLGLPPPPPPAHFQQRRPPDNNLSRPAASAQTHGPPPHNIYSSHPTHHTQPPGGGPHPGFTGSPPIPAMRFSGPAAAAAAGGPGGQPGNNKSYMPLPPPPPPPPRRHQNYNNGTGTGPGPGHRGPPPPPPLQRPQHPNGMPPPTFITSPRGLPPQNESRGHPLSHYGPAPSAPPPPPIHNSGVIMNQGGPPYHHHQHNGTFIPQQQMGPIGGPPMQQQQQRHIPPSHEPPPPLPPITLQVQQQQLIHQYHRHQPPPPPLHQPEQLRALPPPLNPIPHYGMPPFPLQHQSVPPQQHTHGEPPHSVPSHTMGSYTPSANGTATRAPPGISGSIPQSHQIKPSPTLQPTQETVKNVDPDNVAEHWSTHKAPTGVNYYYNSVTKVSTYTRPDCLPLAQNSNTHETTTMPSKPQPVQSTAAVVLTTTNTTTTTTPAKSKKRKWTEFTDKSSGKKYYYDGVTTTWDKPDDYSGDNEGSVKKKKKHKDEDEDSSVVATITKKKKKKHKGETTDSNAVITYHNKEEAVAAFSGLLLAKDVTPTMKWNDVVKLCSNDSRWEACATMGERKQALAEYQTKRANELREEKRQEKMRAKDAFNSLLTDVLPSVRTFHASANTRFGDVRDSLTKDDRFYAVEEEGTREELFYDFVEEMRKREERQKRGRKRDAKDAFLAFLKYREENGGLTFASTWSSFLASLSDSDKTDERFVASPTVLSDSDRQLYFADYVIELQAAEDEKRRRIRDARRRAEKAQRDAYREVIRGMAVDGKILPSTRWRNVEDDISTHESFGPVQAQEREAPREMFEDFVEDWADGYRKDKAFLARLISSSKKRIEVTKLSYEDFTKALLEAAAYSPEVYSDARRVINREDPVSSVKLYCEELQQKAKEAAETTPSFRGTGGRIRRNADDSSEDEGEIVEEGEVTEEGQEPGDTDGVKSIKAESPQPELGAEEE